MHLRGKGIRLKVDIVIGLDVFSVLPGWGEELITIDKFSVDYLLIENAITQVCSPLNYPATKALFASRSWPPAPHMRYACRTHCTQICSAEY